MPSTHAVGWSVGWCPTPTGTFAPDPSVEAVIVADDAVDIRDLPRRLVSLAWIRADPERWLERPWFDDYDVVLASDPDAIAMVRERSSKVATPIPIEPTPDSLYDAIVTWTTATRYGLRVGPPSREVAEQWGDYHFARGPATIPGALGPPQRLHSCPTGRSARWPPTRT